MSEQFILPGQLSNLDTSMTSKDFTSDITSNNIKSTFFKEGESIEFPCVCLDLSKAGVIIKTSMEALKKLLVPRETVEEMRKQEREESLKSGVLGIGEKSPLDGVLGNLDLNSSSVEVEKVVPHKTSYDTLISVYIRSAGDKKVLIGHMREHTARHLLPSFIKSTFPNGTTLYISEDGSRVDEFTKTTLAGVKLEFPY